MNRAERTKAYFEENKERIERLLQSTQSNRLEVALMIQDKMEPRPYTREDFTRKEFHTNLVGKD